MWSCDLPQIRERCRKPLLRLILRQPSTCDCSLQNQYFEMVLICISFNFSNSHCLVYCGVNIFQFAAPRTDRDPPTHCLPNTRAFYIFMFYMSKLSKRNQGILYRRLAGRYNGNHKQVLLPLWPFYSCPVVVPVH
jgi:hypothetical protein